MAFSSSALKLLSAYDSSNDESEEEIPGPRVSVKRTHSGLEISENSRKKRAQDDRKERLPPPSALLQLFKDKDKEQHDHEDSSSQHNGRVRSFAHERGNWASYVFIAVEPTSSLQSFIDVVCTMCESLNLQRASDLHISLTKTVVLKHHWIDSISSSVQTIAQSLTRFLICLGDLRVYTNEEGTRTFIGVVVTAGQETLKKMSSQLDEVLADFRLPPFYEEASFHLSIASCVGNHSDAMGPLLSKLQTTLKMFIHSEPLQWSLNVDKLHFRTGNKYFAFNVMS